ncbi:hypothetical protein WUBG_17731 [Wuchereria bancrofti]|uniref:ATP-dependent helicase Rep n=1 Tax=Wuchereria bancrofti TaxID=6293 RepID=J9E326_WUCBA|nr:hypothetical protein WUBG_17731 [Wuchereria bancrofti]
MSRRAKCWTATIFNMKAFNSSNLEQIGNGLEYGIISKETCSTTNRQHFQCYFKFNSPVLFQTLLNNLPRASHVEKAKGSPYQNYQYCSKESINEEIGRRPEPPNRKRKSSEEQSTLLKKYCRNEINLQQMIEKDNLFVMRNLTKIQQLKSYTIEDRKTITDLYLIIGEPGIGKTTFATKLSKNYFIKTANTEKWWDGYEQQELVILDDFYGWMQPAEIFNLADSKPHLVQIKRRLRKIHQQSNSNNKQQNTGTLVETVSKYDMRAFDRRVTMTWKLYSTSEKSYFGYNFDNNLTSD